ncbi:YqzL family protein [Alkalihalobacillus pseudalcaliphilus]|nr:YqzL family protein [Alkalihalobacillus pseudalcaliphilus]
MLDFSWKVFSMTGNVDMYLLMKEIERDSDQQFEQEITLLNEDFNSPPNH